MTSLVPRDSPNEFALLQAIDQACVAFEQAWIEGKLPALTAYMPDFSADTYSKALRELLWIKWTQLRKRNTPPQLETYTAKFAEFSDVVKDA
jgi:hypothetical protein